MTRQWYDSQAAEREELRLSDFLEDRLESAREEDLTWALAIVADDWWRQFGPAKQFTLGGELDQTSDDEGFAGVDQYGDDWF